MVDYGQSETPWNLTAFLFKGGAEISAKKIAHCINNLVLPLTTKERIDIVTSLHECLIGALSAGGSRFSTKNKIGALRKFFIWVDKNNISLTFSTLPTVFVQWTDYLLHCYRIDKKIKHSTVYDNSRLVATILDHILFNKVSVMKLTRIRKKRSLLGRQYNQQDKQSIEESFLFGHLLVSLCEGLNSTAITKPPPISLILSTGYVLRIYGAPKKITAIFHHYTNINSSIRSKSNDELIKEIGDNPLTTSASYLNLRISAELLLFISQTGMNLQQAHTLRLEQFKYSSYLDGYMVSSYKSRRGGEVSFNIYSNYKIIFERYLSWRNEWFSNSVDELLFPLIRQGRTKIQAPQFGAILKICNGAGVAYIGPNKLRGARVNWLLRESKSPQQTAELSQHTVKTLLSVYSKPHPQIAIAEITHFHTQSDPTLLSTAPGICTSQHPETMVDSPESAPPPDCINAAGCLFCNRHRDIDSQDHIWSLTTFRYLKSLELASFSPSLSANLKLSHPAFLSVERLTSKLLYFSESNQARRIWVEEAQARINEGDYHPAWDVFIRLIESRPTEDFYEP